MKRWFLGTALAALVISGAANAAAEPIPGSVTVINRKTDGSWGKISVPQAEFSRRLGAQVEAINSQISTLRASSGSQWALRSVIVGFSVGIEGGLGKLENASAKPRFRLVYSNQKEAVFP